MARFLTASLKLTLGVTVGLAAAGCSSVRVRPVSKCESIDWWEAGRTDGVAGLTLENALLETTQHCKGKPVDLDAFENGHEAGVIEASAPTVVSVSRASTRSTSGSPPSANL